jgi:hypothetical protein
MPKPQPRTDRATLSALLVSGKLNGHQQTIFQRMFDDIVGGVRISLTMKERAWADSLYEQHKLGDVRYAARKEARARIRKEETSALDKMPRPLKPPGRT